jgi:hypothetical protein
MYLKRYHDIQISPSGIWRILKRLDMSRLLAGSTGAPAESASGSHRGARRRPPPRPGPLACERRLRVAPIARAAAGR